MISAESATVNSNFIYFKYLNVYLKFKTIKISC